MSFQEARLVSEEPDGYRTPSLPSSSAARESSRPRSTLSLSNSTSRGPALHRRSSASSDRRRGRTLGSRALLWVEASTLIPLLARDISRTYTRATRLHRARRPALSALRDHGFQKFGEVVVYGQPPGNRAQTTTLLRPAKALITTQITSLTHT